MGSCVCQDCDRQQINRSSDLRDLRDLRPERPERLGGFIIIIIPFLSEHLWPSNSTPTSLLPLALARTLLSSRAGIRPSHRIAPRRPKRATSAAVSSLLECIECHPKTIFLDDPAPLLPKTPLPLDAGSGEGAPVSSATPQMAAARLVSCTTRQDYSMLP